MKEWIRGEAKGVTLHQRGRRASLFPPFEDGGVHREISPRAIPFLYSIKREQGFSLMEVMLSLFLFTLLLTSLLPLLPLLREREARLQEEIAIEQEAIRFFSYMENQNMNLSSWELRGPYSVRIYTYGRGGKWYVHDGFRIVEKDSSSYPGGNIYLAHDVRGIRFTSEDLFLIMEITLGSEEKKRDFRGILPRYTEGEGAP